VDIVPGGEGRRPRGDEVVLLTAHHHGQPRCAARLPGGWLRVDFSSELATSGGGGRGTAEGSRVCEPNFPPRTLLIRGVHSISRAPELRLWAVPCFRDLFSVLRASARTRKSAGKVQFSRDLWALLEML
jgi:hypothetical protein